MKIPEISKIYAEQSKQVSEVVRPLALAGIAIIWVFKQEVQGKPVIAKRLVFAGIFISIGLFLDLLQYVWGTQNYKSFYQAKMAQADSMITSGSAPAGFNKYEEDWDPPPDINKVPLRYFWWKIVFIGLGYLLIVIYLIDYLEYL